MAACSGTIDTPTDEFPARDANEDDAPAAPAAPRAAAAAPAAPRAAAAAPAAAAPASRPAAAAPAAASPAAADAPAAAEPVAAASAGGGDPTFETDVWPIFQSSCSPCHQAGGAGGQNIGSDDLDEALQDSIDFEDGVLAQIESGGMPLGCGGAPGSSAICVSAEDFDTIKSWYAAGTPE